MTYDVTSAALHSALRGLGARRRVLADNMANVDTAGFLAGTVSFEDSLADALTDIRSGRSRGDATAVAGGVTPARGTSTSPTRLNGNNVQIDDEMLAQERTDLAYETVLAAMDAKLRLLRTAIGG